MRAAAVVSPLPRRITSGTSLGIETSRRAPSRSGERTSPTAPGGSPAASSAGRSTSSTSTVTVPSAAPPVRRTAALRLLRSWPATSSATFGRASKFAPTAPIGIRRSLTCRPFGSVHEPASRSSGSTPAIASSCSARPSIAGVVEAQPVERPLVDAVLAASTSAALAARSFGSPLADARAGRGGAPRTRDRRATRAPPLRRPWPPARSSRGASLHFAY